jgi:hypothetical protein
MNDTPTVSPDVREALESAKDITGDLLNGVDLSRYREQVQETHDLIVAALAKLSPPVDPDIGEARKLLAQAMAERAGLVWERLSEKPDMTCGHGMPEGCKQYWFDLADTALAALRGRELRSLERPGDDQACGPTPPKETE